MAEQAQRRDWSVVQIEAQPTPDGRKAAPQKLARAIEAGARRLRIGSAGDYLKNVFGSIGSFNVTLGVTGVPARGATECRADSGNLDIDLEELDEDISTATLGSAADRIFIDEMQDLDDELLGALVSLQHLADQRADPSSSLVLACQTCPERSVPSGPTRGGCLITVRSAPYGRRHLPSHEPAGHVSGRRGIEGPRFGSGRLSLVPADIRKAVWDGASSKTANFDDARLAVQIGTGQLDAGFFSSRWQRAIPAERHYLRAMVADQDEASSTAQIAARLGRAAASL